MNSGLLSHLQAGVAVVLPLGEGQHTLVLVDMAMAQEQRSHHRGLVIDVDQVLDHHLMGRDKYFILV